jgi:hypothetical protein
MKYIILIIMVLLTNGCQTVDSKPKTVIMNTNVEKPKQFVLLGAGEYEEDITLALFKEGFKVKPIAITSEVTELETPTKIIKYKQAGYKYALKTTFKDGSMTCVFSDGHILTVTMSVIDLESNETLAIIKQEGPNKECPPLTPVWPLLAKELSNAWK